MRRHSGMTLIELMVVLAIVALLTAIALPSYQQYSVRGIRSQGQNFLMDLAQSQEQFFLDQRQYATDLGNGAGLLNRTIPVEVSANYTLTQPFNVNNAANPATFELRLTPIAGKVPARQNDGVLIINSTQQRWRSLQNTAAYDSTIDCTWEATTCKTQ
ncbi:MAG: ral secretion pathway protein [Betaproteobacteria bacterium]|nr:ral secretion pathway protein [Betaproteobacteria bacterium]